MGDARDGEVRMPWNGTAPLGVVVEAVQQEVLDTGSAQEARESERVRKERNYVPLREVVRSHVTTAEAAFYLNRRCQTLRIWRCRGEGPLQPVRVGKLLMWSVEDIRALLRVGASV